MHQLNNFFTCHQIFLWLLNVDDKVGFLHFGYRGLFIVKCNLLYLKFSCVEVEIVVMKLQGHVSGTGLLSEAAGKELHCRFDDLCPYAIRGYCRYGEAFLILDSL